MMKNNIHQIQIKEMLQDAFLDFSNSNENLHQMTAQFIFSEEFKVNIPTQGEKKFLRRFLPDRSVTIRNLTYFLAGMILVGVFIVLLNDSSNQAEKGTFSHPQKNRQIISVESKNKEVTLPQNPEDKPRVALSAVSDTIRNEEVIVQDNQTFFENNTDYVQMTGIGDGNFIGKNKKQITIEIPVISAEEAVKNKERKQSMIKQLLKKDRKEWVLAPMGTFQFMEQPVSVQSFYIMSHEVSNIQYRTFLYDLIIKERFSEYAKAATQDSNWASGQGFNVAYVKYYFNHPAYDQYPAVNLSTEGAEMFCIWLTEEANKWALEKRLPLINDLRIPAEAEWEYAAACGLDSNLYGFTGNSLRHVTGKFNGDFKANFRRGRGDFEGIAGNLHDNADITAPVWSYWANQWGLYNMSGNVAEMVYSGINGAGPVVLKGGSWKDLWEGLLRKNRDHNSPIPSPMAGFRPVFTAYYSK